MLTIGISTIKSRKHVVLNYVVENISNFPVKNNFKITPKAAIPHTTKKSVHPKVCSKEIKHTGVYVPAIKK